ncbi:MAG: SusD/RagB family nutrient-binding outer membrane lipoprotein [Tannerellaceae bacterium]|nr:SusD/RagB family nutrient-binding outer membrane lipoprotein [Tannerellaceae bacterium]
MKLKNNIIAAVTSGCMMFGLFGCSDFGDVNKDPENISNETMSYTYVFTNVQKYMYGTEYEVWRNAIIYCTSMLQQTASVKSYFNGDKYTYSAGYNTAYWDRHYPNSIRYIVDVINAWEDNDEYYLDLQMMRVMRVLMLQRMTDMYGDIPYSEAGLGFLDDIQYPKYDTQQSIYLDMLNELKEAGEILAAAERAGTEKGEIGDHDIMYQGSITKWRKFTYSLMVRVAMRLSKVEPETARTWVNTALSGGIFENYTDSGIIKHPGAVETNDTGEPYAKIFCHEAPDDYRMGEFFINLLKDTEDPRLEYISTVVKYPSYKYSSGNWELGNTDPAVQLGMPNGYDQRGDSSPTDIRKAPNYPFPGPDEEFVDDKGEVQPYDPKDEGYWGLAKYSVANRSTFSHPESPSMILTHSTIQLLLAEAAYRGWISGSAESYYIEGVTAAMKQFSFYDVTSNVPNITDAQISDYLAANPYNTANALELINTQYYITTFCDAYETFANWRRSGYPVLVPVDYEGNATGGTIPRRFTYPSSETSYNTAHYQEAINRQGPDNMTTRVWWDVE